MKEYKGTALLDENNNMRCVRIDLFDLEPCKKEQKLKQVPCKVLLDDSKEGIEKMYKEFNARKLENKIKIIREKILDILGQVGFE